MDQLVGHVFGRAAVELIALGINAAATSSTNKNDVRPPPSVQPQRAVLIASSTITFGNDCERLVNIAYRTSQTFPTMMGTYADVIHYLRKELAKHYSDEYFHIIISKNHAFGFSVDDSQYFAEIEQDLYRILIYSTKQNLHTKMDTHDANSQMSFVWK